MSAVKQIIKHKRIVYPSPIPSKNKIDTEDGKNIISKTNEKTSTPNNKKKKKDKDMVNNKVNLAEEIANRMEDENVKIVKKDRGLIERTESSKIILTEDNRQVLND
jgi:hypothetical protein